eukprot:7536020-Ditylum_brightwellii.AAC.1
MHSDLEGGGYGHLALVLMPDHYQQATGHLFAAPGHPGPNPPIHMHLCFSMTYNHSIKVKGTELEAIHESISNLIAVLKVLYNGPDTMAGTRDEEENFYGWTHGVTAGVCN